MDYFPNRGDAYRMMPGPAGQPALRGMVPDLPDIGWREPPSAAVFGGISLVHVSRAAASLRGQNIVVAMASKFVRSAADHVSGIPPLRVADEPGWDTMALSG